MSVPSTTDPAVTKHPAGTTLPAPRARSRARLRAVPDVSRHAEPSVAPPAAVPDVSRHAGPVALRSGLAPPDLTGPSVSPGARPDPTGPSVSPGARPDPTGPSVSPGARPDLGAPATAAGDRAAPAPLTVTIQVDGGPPEVRDRLLAALRDLVATAGDAVAVAGAPEESRPRVARPPVTPGGEGLVQLDPQPRAAFRDGRLLELSRLEYDLLLFLARHPRQVFSRGQLLAEVWGHVHAGARTVDVHVSRLRQKLGGHGLIATVRGVGYRLADAAPVRVVPPRAADMS